MEDPRPPSDHLRPPDAAARTTLRCRPKLRGRRHMRRVPVIAITEVTGRASLIVRERDRCEFRGWQTSDFRDFRDARRRRPMPRLSNSAPPPGVVPDDRKPKRRTMMTTLARAWSIL